jgi:GT2 family glycosyltransferase
MTAEPAVTLAVVSWNTRDLLERCLRSLRPEAEAGRAEVWVVDNDSADGSAELVRESFGWAELVASPENLGFGPAVNLVAERTSAPYLAAANADVELEPGALGALVAAAEREPGAGALAPRLLLADGTTQHSVHRFPTLPYVAAFNLGLHRLGPGIGDRMLLEGHWDPERARPVDWAHGAFLLIRRSAWEETGGFDPEQWMYAEDLDLCWRLHRHGWSVEFVPAARVRHRVAAAAEQAWGDARTERWLAATYAWMERRRGRVTARVYALLNLAGAAGRWAMLRPLAAVRPARWAAPAEEMSTWTRLHLAALRGTPLSDGGANAVSGPGAGADP